VEPDEDHDVDWRDAQAYAPLLDADRSIFAWEWLRRDRAYRAAARAAAFGGAAVCCERPRPEHWGLHAFEGPELAAPHARPVWTAQVHPPVLMAVAAGAGSGADAFDLGQFRSIATLVRTAAGREHLLLSDGLRTVRLDILAGSIDAGPVNLRYLLSGLESSEKPLVTLRRLIALHKTRHFSLSLHRREVRARRWVLSLRAFDALVAGADQRKIAAVLLSGMAVEPRWRSHASSLRSQVQRLVRTARHMASGGYRALLR
jgi:hypothetical protein